MKFFPYFYCLSYLFMSQSLPATDTEKMPIDGVQEEVPVEGVTREQKRKRRVKIPLVKKACDSCRERHWKCSEKRPCEKCSENGLDCNMSKNINFYMVSVEDDFSQIEEPSLNSQHEEQEPPIKKKKRLVKKPLVRIACDNCHKMRIKCSNRKPCGQCTRHQRTCTFDRQESIRRPLQNYPQVDTLAKKRKLAKDKHAKPEVRELSKHKNRQQRPVYHEPNDTPYDAPPTAQPSFVSFEQVPSLVTCPTCQHQYSYTPAPNHNNQPAPKTYPEPSHQVGNSELPYSVPNQNFINQNFTYSVPTQYSANPYQEYWPANQYFVSPGVTTYPLPQVPSNYVPQSQGITIQYSMSVEMSSFAQDFHVPFSAPNFNAQQPQPTAQQPAHVPYLYTYPDDVDYWYLEDND